MYKAQEPNKEDGSRVSGTVLEVCGEDKTLHLKIIVGVGSTKQLSVGRSCSSGTYIPSVEYEGNEDGSLQCACHGWSKL